MSEQGGRYQRSMGGMVGALVVTVAVIVAFVAFRAATRDDLVVDRPPVDYLTSVEGIQAGDGLPVVYPARLPDGWQATVVDYDVGTSWSLSLLTDEESFVGLRQGTDPVEDLVEEFVDADAEEGEPVELDSQVAGTWRTFTDSGGDYAVAAEVEGTSVVVLGGAGEEQVRGFAESLVTTPLDPS
ncbi:DUF4245 domain-containing protein [Nocardioides donggukensis]|uniref:DUF4245 domain-containing protein n=1 Tax=Nocardioides donggukensis TaxID=2774019 RepID=A0A927K511_9ACTN|nr:DUF4245 domain-containing protein [Nocardioides donggukensis]MBD8870367.1 DUF4245 domain-containing protein [Nocardioides donggukensis]